MIFCLAKTNQANLLKYILKNSVSKELKQKNLFSTCRNIPRYVKIVEVGPRDGLQNESQFVSTEDKINLITKLAKAGCPTIEATSFVSPKWIPQLSDAEQVLKEIKATTSNIHAFDGKSGIGGSLRTTTFSCLVPNLQGMKQAISCHADEIAIFTSVSETFSQKNVNCSIDETFTKRFKYIAEEAKEYDIPMRGYVSCVLGCPYEGHIPYEKVAQVSERLIKLGCFEVSLVDTTGVGTPNKTLEMIEEVEKFVDIESLAVHFHDTYGQALTNIYAALTKGISTVDSSVSGLGGCPYAVASCGNVATEDVVYMLNGMDIRTGIDLSKLIDAGTFISNKLNHNTRSRVAAAISGNSSQMKKDDHSIFTPLSSYAHKHFM